MSWKGHQKQWNPAKLLRVAVFLLFFVESVKLFWAMKFFLMSLFALKGATWTICSKAKMCPVMHLNALHSERLAMGALPGLQSVSRLPMEWKASILRFIPARPTFISKNEQLSPCSLDVESIVSLVLSIKWSLNKISLAFAHSLVHLHLLSRWRRGFSFLGWCVFLQIKAQPGNDFAVLNLWKVVPPLHLLSVPLFSDE